MRHPPRAKLKRDPPAATAHANTPDDAGLTADEAGLNAVLALDWAKLTARDDTMLDSKRNLVDRLGEAARAMPPPWPSELYRYLYAHVCLTEDDYRLRLAAAQQIGCGGDAAWDALREMLADTDRAANDWKEWNVRLAKGSAPERTYVVLAWLLPMLLESVRRPEARAALDATIKRWMKCVARNAPWGQMPLCVEAALAQGFKYAANRRPHHSHENAESRDMLQKHAKAMIHKARFWYSRLSLLHALCLWEIAHNVYPGHGQQAARSGRYDPDSVVGGWLRREGGEEESHRFVREAAELARHALRTNQPEKFLWIDESGVVTKVGSSAEDGGYQAVKPLWIPPSAGWLALDRTAQQLVADVLIVLNLAERGEEAGTREERLANVNSRQLPKCITGERSDFLQPGLTAGAVAATTSSSACKPRCQVDLCPYPARGEQPYRVELSEAFCRGQQVALRRHRPAPWQEGSGVELRRFWREMERRARI